MTVLHLMMQAEPEALTTTHPFKMKICLIDFSFDKTITYILKKSEDTDRQKEENNKHSQSHIQS